ncbi:MAG: M28 family peptidase [Polyangiaceae bacterium]
MARGGGEVAKKRRNPLRWVLLLLLLLVVGVPLTADQLGVRRVSGLDFPASDPLAADLRKRVGKLASAEWAGRKPGLEGNAEAALYLAAAMRDAGLDPLPSLGGFLMPLVEPTRKVPTRLGHNVVGWLPATEAPPAGAPPAPVILLGAHFDHVGPTPEGMLLGADDNASSVAVLLAATPLLKAMGARRHPVMVVFFNTEEPPYFGTPNMGSLTFARTDPPVELGAPPRVKLAVILDLLGGVVWRAGSDLLLAAGAEKARGLGAVVDGVSEDGLEVRRLGIHMIENIPGRTSLPVSDYHVFRERQLPFLFLSSGRTPRYHRPTDLPETLHYDRMARSARWITKLVAAVDAAPEFPFEPDLLDLRKDVQSMLAVLDRAVTPEISIPGTSPMSLAQLYGDRRRIQRMTAEGYNFSRADEIALERAGFRLQCLLWSMPICFTL